MHSPRPPARWLAVLLATGVGAAMPGAADEPPERAEGEARWLRQPAAPIATTTATLSPFQPAGVTSRVRRTRMQFEALVADQAWDEAIELVERLQAEHGGELTKLDDSPDDEESDSGFERFAPITRLCQRLMGSLPPDGLQVYRDRVEATARARVDAARGALDETGLRRVVEEFAATEAAADAMLALAELALERGDTTAARRWLNRVTRLAIDPAGRPMAATLVLLSTDAPSELLATTWTEAPRPSDALVAPEGLAGRAADALARLALTSVREGDLRRARAELRLLEAIGPDAEGRMAGRVQPLGPAIATLIDAAASEAAAADAARARPVSWAWKSPVRLATPAAQPNVAAQNVWRRMNQLQLLQQRRMQQLRFGPAWARAANMPAPEKAPELQAAAAGGSAYYVEGYRVKRVDLATGEATDFEIPGVAPAPKPSANRPGLGDLAANPAAPGVVFRGRVVVNGRVMEVGPNGRLGTTPLTTRVEPGLTVVDDVLFARVVRQATAVTGNRRRQQLNETLIGVELPAGDRLVLEIKPRPPEDNAAGESFVGRPVVQAGRLYTLLRRPGTRVDSSVACFSAGSGAEIWRRDLGSGEGIGGAPSLEVVGDSVYVANDLGAVFALDRDTGRVRWLTQYERRASAVATVDALPGAACRVAGDQLVVAARDASELFALDAATGRPLWSVPNIDADTQLLGVLPSPDGAVAVLAGQRVAGYDALTGERRYAWPASQKSGVRGFGAPALVDGTLYWPSRDALYRFDATTGAMSASPIDLAPVSDRGANVFANDLGLLVAGPDRLRLLAYATAIAEPSRRAARLNSTTPGAVSSDRR